MSCSKKGDCLLVIWKDMDTRNRYVIGELFKNEKYRFVYNQAEVKKASDVGFSLLIPFPDIEKVYENEELFPFFSSRLPNQRRPDINQILAKYEMDSYDHFGLLKASRGILPTDSFEFAQPICLEESDISRTFYIAGTRHYEFCESEKCDIISDIKPGDSVILRSEPQNHIDPFAVVVFDCNLKKLGYIPKFYSKQVTEVLSGTRDMSCRILSIREELKKCQECIKVELLIK